MLTLSKSYTLSERVSRLSLFFIVTILLICAISIGLLYSVTGGDSSPWAKAQIMRMFIGLCVFFIIALSPIQWIFNTAYLLHASVIVLLIIVLVDGQTAGGAQRWMNIFSFTFQPSEIAKVSIILVLARYYADYEKGGISHVKYLIFPLGITILTGYLIMKQPDLGTATMLVVSVIVLLYAVGLNKYYFIMSMVLGFVSVPIVWSNLKYYQKERVIGFLNPENDPLGSGYHVIQSEIALGSGGFYGKGFLNGTQTQLNFIPEKHTDFIFTILGEEFGFLGAMLLLILYFSIIVYGYIIAERCRSIFGRLLSITIVSSFALNIFVNMAMVMGLLPVVGIPLPLVSFGGTALVVQFLAFGLLMNVGINHRTEF